ncbi:MAG: hypothetical protein L0196_02150 [candidate division Zixibacteria bacterium]|nr:hypothetical protein [candidate division Zixibacteria bacterium]
MKMMRWFLGIIILLGVVFFLLGTEPTRAATASPTPTGDEHPWDKVKGAYRVEVVLVTDEYMLLAVWYTKDQVYPVLIWVKYQSQQAVATLKSGPSSKKSFTSFF